MSVETAEPQARIGHFISRWNQSHDIFSCPFCLMQRQNWYWADDYMRRLVQRIEMPLGFMGRCANCRRETPELYSIRPLGGLELCAYCIQDIVIDAFNTITTNLQLAARG